MSGVQVASTCFKENWPLPTSVYPHMQKWDAMALSEAIETTGADFECRVSPEEMHQGFGFDACTCMLHPCNFEDMIDCYDVLQVYCALNFFNDDQERSYWAARANAGAVTRVLAAVLPMLAAEISDNPIFDRQNE